MKVKTEQINTESGIIPTRPGIQLSNCKKGGVGKTLLSKLDLLQNSFYGIIKDYFSLNFLKLK